ncbi:hypothetical protein C5E45_20640 [Nocardia nova]|uniref:UBA domain-containing protein n=1 Tax=Nocardia nova TaxID=37330 RepID=A0A2S6AMJ3_9NOCA|nr:hypothetical protein [Nocardia nova]PPJ36455.1 hypothetical protein C5E45_20640 [Nocardia nova]
MTTFADNPAAAELDPDLPHTDSAPERDPDTAEQPVSTRPAHGQVAGQLLWLDPDKLEKARNRPSKPIDPGVKASIVKHGNFLPLVTVPTESGGYAVWDGWHRVEILRDTEHMALCAVYPRDTSAEQLETEAERIALQFNSGAHRYAQNEIDRADAIAQMLELGFDVDETRETLVGITRDEARAVKKVTRSESAREALYSSDLDLLQSAAAAEHFGDDPEAIDRLIAAAAVGQFDHALKVMLDERAEIEAQERAAAAYAEIESSFTEAGLTVLTGALADNVLALEDLLDADGNTPTPETVPHEHLAVVLVQQARVLDSEERIDIDQVDERTELFPDDDPDPGMYHVRDVEVLDEFAPVYYCTDPDAAGLTRTELDDESDEPDEVPDSVPTVPQESEAEREARLARAAAQAERERKQAEEAAAKRAEATILNRYARSATSVRREWLTENLFGGQKTVPPGGLELIGRVIAHPNLLNAYHARSLAAQLGTKVPNSPSSDGIKARDNHGGLRALLHVVAAVEADLQPTKDHPDYYRRVSSLHGDYMKFLASRGYRLAPVERVLTGELTKAQAMAGPGATVDESAEPGNDEQVPLTPGEDDDHGHEHEVVSADESADPADRGDVDVTELDDTEMVVDPDDAELVQPAA